MRNRQEPTLTSLVLTELQGADDFKTVRQLRDLLKMTPNQVTCSLKHLHNHKCVDFISDATGTWWYATPETDNRCKCLNMRTPEVKPRKPRKRRTIWFG